MESQLTLVDPNSDKRTIQLMFSKNSVLNADLLVNGQIRYTISTTDRHANKTTINDSATNKEIVYIEKRTFHPNKIVFANRNGGAEQKLTDIMNEYKIDGKNKVHKVQTPSGDFFWKVDDTQHLNCYSFSNPNEPVVQYQNITSPKKTFVLVVNKDLEEILDYIISTFLVLENGLRNGNTFSYAAANPMVAAALSGMAGSWVG